MATDLVDGALARRAGPTRLGRDFDSTADTVFLDAALRGAVERRRLDPRLLALERGRLLVGTAVTFASYFGGSEPAPVQRNRGPAAVLAAAGALLATSGRRRAAEPLIGAAIGYRTLTRLRARSGLRTGRGGRCRRRRGRRQSAAGWSAGVVCCGVVCWGVVC